MIHYHGLPITPNDVCAKVISGGHAFVSYFRPDQLNIAASLCQSFAVDNGAFSAWKKGTPVDDWEGYYEWLEPLTEHPAFDFAVIPDVIDGNESDNDRLIRDWPFKPWMGAPVWHLHESLERLKFLTTGWSRICIGSSGQYADLKTPQWWQRMAEAMDTIYKEGDPSCKLHGLRMLDPDVFTRFPFSSADSTNIAQNVSIDKRWEGSYQPRSQSVRGIVMRDRIETFQSAETFEAGIYLQGSVFVEQSEDK